MYTVKWFVYYDLNMRTYWQIFKTVQKWYDAEILWYISFHDVYAFTVNGWDGRYEIQSIILFIAAEKHKANCHRSLRFGIWLEIVSVVPSSNSKKINVFEWYHIYIYIYIKRQREREREREYIYNIYIRQFVFDRRNKNGFIWPLTKQIWFQRFT